MSCCGGGGGERRTGRPKKGTILGVREEGPMQEVTGHTNTGKLWKGFKFGAGRHGNDDMIRFIFLKDDSGCHGGMY